MARRNNLRTDGDIQMTDRTERNIAGRMRKKPVLSAILVSGAIISLGLAIYKTPGLGANNPEYSVSDRQVSDCKQSFYETHFGQRNILEVKCEGRDVFTTGFTIIDDGDDFTADIVSITRLEDNGAVVTSTYKAGSPNPNIQTIIDDSTRYLQNECNAIFGEKIAPLYKNLGD